MFCRLQKGGIKLSPPPPPPLSIVPLHKLSVRNNKQLTFEWRGEKMSAHCFVLQLLLTLQTNQSDKNFTSQGRARESVS